MSKHKGPSPGIAMGLVLTLALIIPAVLAASDRAAARAQVGTLLKQVRADLDAGRYDDAMKGIDEIRAIDPNNQDAFYFATKTHLAQADTAQALETLSQGLERSPLSSRLRLLLVRVKIQRKDHDEADRILKEVFRFKPNNPEALYLSGMISLARGDTATALTTWQNALSRAVNKGRSR